MPGPQRHSATEQSVPLLRPWQKGGDEARSFGAWLRSQREVREISLREIADTTRIGLRYLQALEEDRFEVLPAPVFARGFLREYAKYVGLDPDEVLTFFLAALQAREADRPAEEQPRPPARASASWASALLLLALVVMLLVVITAMAIFAKRRRERVREVPPPIAAPVRQPAPPPPPVEPEPEILAPLRVTLDFVQGCWVEARVDGKRAVSEERVQGESLQLDAQEEVVLTLGNAGGVLVEVNGHPLDLGKTPGQVLRNLKIDLVTAHQLEEDAG